MSIEASDNADFLKIRKGFVSWKSPQKTALFYAEHLSLSKDLEDRRLSTRIILEALGFGWVARPANLDEMKQFYNVVRNAGHQANLTSNTLKQNSVVKLLLEHEQKKYGATVLNRQDALRWIYDYNRHCGQRDISLFQNLIQADKQLSEKNLKEGSWLDGRSIQCDSCTKALYGGMPLKVVRVHPYHHLFSSFSQTGFKWHDQLMVSAETVGHDLEMGGSSDFLLRPHALLGNGPCNINLAQDVIISWSDKPKKTLIGRNVYIHNGIASPPNVMAIGGREEVSSQPFVSFIQYDGRSYTTLHFLNKVDDSWLGQNMYDFLMYALAIYADPMHRQFIFRTLYPFLSDVQTVESRSID